MKTQHPFSGCSLHTPFNCYDKNKGEAFFTHTFQVELVETHRNTELCCITQYVGLTSLSSAAAEDSQRPVALCGVTPECAECASEETGWEGTGHSRATAAASRAPHWNWVTCKKRHVRQNEALDEMEVGFISLLNGMSLDFLLSKQRKTHEG